MPPTDATAHAATTATDTGADPSPGTAGGSAAEGTDSEDTLDLRLPDELIALFAAEADTGEARSRAPMASPASMAAPAFVSAPAFVAVPFVAVPPFVAMADDDLLDHVADWGPAVTPAGVFQLVPVQVDRDLPLIDRWMNDPAVAEFWELAGPRAVTESHLQAQLSADGRSIPCLGVLEGTPMSYWEIYRADLDPLARLFPLRPHDTGIHLLIGEVADRGRKLGSTLLRAVADLVLNKRPACARVIAEPDLRNTPSVAAFLSAGFRFSAEIDLPAKRAALMIRDRSLRNLL
ncbi:GNAT family N-acetyltransferase [Streptomyces sp. NPDC050534]|uniref:GNAT family N-acetyltransferase n=1 Tax=Streptomyces sp. NPDC050534 TaxID=3365625 RepID=UPI00378F93F0